MAKSPSSPSSPPSPPPSLRTFTSDAPPGPSRVQFLSSSCDSAASSLASGVHLMASDAHSDAAASDDDRGDAPGAGSPGEADTYRELVAFLSSPRADVRRAAAEAARAVLASKGDGDAADGDWRIANGDARWAIYDLPLASLSPCAHTPSFFGHDRSRVDESRRAPMPSPTATIDRRVRR